MERTTRITPLQIIVLAFAIALALVILSLNVFLVGGADFIINLDALLPLPLAILISVLLFRLWWGSVRQEVGRRIWGAFLVGILLWTIAEVIWNVYAFMGRELPFPALSDYAWVVAYIFFFWAFTLRFRSLQVSLKRNEILALVLLYAPLFFLTLFISIIPILLEGEQNLLVVVLSIFYPIADLVIPLRAMVVMFALRKGELIRPWALLGASFLCFSVADLGFSYAQWNGIYWPGGAPNFISIFGDWIYIVAYIVMALGVSFVPRMAAEPATRPLGAVSAALSAATQPVQPPVLVLTDADGRICYISAETYQALGLTVVSRGLGENIATVLGIGQQEIAAIIARDSEAGTSRSRAVTLQPNSGRPRPAHLTVLPSYDARGKFIGANLLLRPLVAHTPPVLDDNRRVLEILRADESPSDQADRGTLLAWYFRAQIRVLYVLVARLAGVDVANGLMNTLHTIARENQWAIQLGRTGLEVTDALEVSLEERARIYRSLLKRIADYAVVVASYATTAYELQFLDSTLDEKARRLVQAYGLCFPGYIPRQEDPA